MNNAYGLYSFFKEKRGTLIELEGGELEIETHVDFAAAD
jgi:hypothetical protein